MNKKIKIGDVIPFGKYKWRVLDAAEDRALILSEKVIEKRVYHEQDAAATWETCSLREYLNGKFLGRFDASKIARATISNTGNPHYGTDGGNDTDDCIFLLSIEEVCRYFSDSIKEPIKPPEDNSREGCENGLEYYRRRESFSTLETLLVKNAPKHGGKFACSDSWWLRSPGKDPNCAAYVSVPESYPVECGGRVSLSGATQSMIFCEMGVRPAMWLKICGGNT
jgi:hypothetical protein